MNLKEKIDLLKKNITQYKKILVAFSGGVDSSLLLRICVDLLGNKNVISATADSITYTKKELNQSKEFARELNIKHIVFTTKEFKDQKFIKNSPLRCYYCKKNLFKRLIQIKDKHHCDIIMDGANYDDLNDFRPGTKAEKEFKIATPLKDSCFTKKDIREYSKKLGLKTFNYPSLACLATRIPYNEKITREKIEMIKNGEEFLSKYNFNNLRIRTNNKTARIEVEEKDFNVVLKKRGDIIKNLKKTGYKYITLDIEGFRSGSLNETIEKSKKSR